MFFSPFWIPNLPSCPRFPRPQHVSASTLTFITIAQHVWPAQARLLVSYALESTPSFASSPGESCVSTLESSPSCPYRLPPQHLTRSVAPTTAHVKLSPSDTFLTSLSPGTIRGAVTLPPKNPSPSCPASLAPQHHSDPFCATTQLCRPPVSAVCELP